MKDGFRNQFLFADTKDDVRAKLRLHHKDGHIREYVREFYDLMLEIPKLSYKEALFSFMDGLNRWAKLKLQRRDVQDIKIALLVSESLIEFQKKEGSKDKGLRHLQAKAGETRESDAKQRADYGLCYARINVDSEIYPIIHT